MPAQVHLVDASPYIFRAYFSIPTSFTDPEGQPVNAVYGFSQFLRRLREEEKPTHIALAFDRSLTTSFRNKIYPEYKAQRELPPPELEAQLRNCERLGRALGMTTFSDEEFEADDLIGTLWRPLRSEGHRVVVVSNDKDLAQLVDEGTELFDFAKGERYDEAKVVEKFGVRPNQIIDYLGLAGDSVDNIPGVRGVGPKTAVALLQAYDDLEAIYEHLDEVPSLAIRGAKSLAKKLEEQRKTAFLSKQLATIALDATAEGKAPAEGGVNRLILQEPNLEQLDALVAELGFDPLRRGRS